MNKVLRKSKKCVKELEKLGVICLNKNTETGAELNAQIIVEIVEDLLVRIDKERYDMCKNDEAKLIDKLIISSVGEENLISKFNDDFKKDIIKKYFCLDDPELIFRTYCFVINYEKKAELDQEALKQINEGKFKNYLYN